VWNLTFSAWVVSGCVLLLLVMLVGTPVWALHPDPSSEIENLKRRIELLESGQERSAYEPFTLLGMGKRLSFTGLIELEAYQVHIEGGDEESNMSLATAQFEISVEVNDYLNGYIVFLHEEDAEPSVDIDEALVILTCPAEFLHGQLSLTSGKLYVPFGHFESHFITDPLTLDLGETNDTALYVGWDVADSIALKAGVFSGETDTAGDNDTIDSFVASIEVLPAPGLTLGASYISDLAESDIELVRDDGVLGNVYKSSIPGIGAFLLLARGDFIFVAEYLAATRDFHRTAVEAAIADEGDLTGRRPRALNLELAYLPFERWEFAVRGERARDFQNDSARYGGVVSHSLMEHVLVGLEYLHSDGKGEDNNPSHTWTGQLAFQF